MNVEDHLVPREDGSTGVHMGSLLSACGAPVPDGWDVVVSPEQAHAIGDALASVSPIYTDLATGEPMDLEDSMDQDGMSISRDAERKPGLTLGELEAFVARCRDAGISGDAVVKARPKGLRQHVARVWVNSADTAAATRSE